LARFEVSVIGPFIETNHFAVAVRALPRPSPAVRGDATHPADERKEAAHRAEDDARSSTNCSTRLALDERPPVRRWVRRRHRRAPGIRFLACNRRDRLDTT
jgi:hypothetical protein